MVFLLSLFAIMMLRRDFEFQTHKSEPFVVKNTQNNWIFGNKEHPSSTKLRVFAIKKKQKSNLFAEKLKFS